MRAPKLIQERGSGAAREVGPALSLHGLTPRVLALVPALLLLAASGLLAISSQATATPGV